MAKEKQKEKQEQQLQQSKEAKEAYPNSEEERFKAIEAKLPPEAREKLREIREKLKKFQDRALEKFDKYIMAIGLLPPARQQQAGQHAANAMPAVQGDAQQQQTQTESKDINVLVLVDDSDSEKMGKAELKDKLEKIMQEMAKEIEPNLNVQTMILSDIWTNAFDAKYDLLQVIALAAPVYDTGMLSAIKIAEIHKSMVLKKFEKYIISYVLAGSLVQGRATKTSDIDVWIVIDDTDVKKMTRAELKDKLRAIIIGMGIEAGEITGIRNKLNIQVYILTEFWDSLREANPVIFTLLRDGVPFYDRGIFMPWKQLLRMGKIRPSAEAIDMFMSTGHQMLTRIKAKINEIGMEDIYYAILTPSQAALMMFGIPPPSPRETAELVREIFVKKEKMLEEKYVKILEESIRIRKDIEHGKLKQVSGAELDKLMADADEYLARIKKLFSQIEEMRDKENVAKAHDTVMSVARDVLRAEGIEEVSDDEIAHKLKALVNKGLLPLKTLRSLEFLNKAVKEYTEGKLTKPEVGKTRSEADGLIRALVEHLERKRARELDRAKIRVKHGDKFGEVLLLGDTAYIIHDINNRDKELTKAKIKEDDTLAELTSSSIEEFEKALATAKTSERLFIKESLFDQLKKIFGRDVEILVG